MFFVISGACFGQESAATTADIVITNAKLVNGTGERLEGAGLIIRDGVIAGMLKEGEEPPPSKTKIDARGKTVMPGLIDTHVHLAVDPSGTDLESERAYVRNVVHGKLEQFLNAGITTIRDMGAHYQVIVELRNEVRDKRRERTAPACRRCRHNHEG